MARSASPPSPHTLSVHLVDVVADGASVRVRSVTSPREEWGLGGGIVSTASPAAAAVRLLADGQIEGRGALPPERCIDPDRMFAELEDRGVSVRGTGAIAGGRMKVGVPTEIKPDEYRVALTPVGARELDEHGHEVLIETGAGEGSGVSDADYEAQGARILPDAAAVFGEAEMVLR